MNAAKDTAPTVQAIPHMPKPMFYQITNILNEGAWNGRRVMWQMYTPQERDTIQEVLLQYTANLLGILDGVGGTSSLEQKLAECQALAVQVAHEEQNEREMRTRLNSAINGQYQLHLLDKRKGDLTRKIHAAEKQIKEQIERLEALQAICQCLADDDSDASRG